LLNNLKAKLLICYQWHLTLRQPKLQGGAAAGLDSDQLKRALMLNLTRRGPGVDRFPPLQRLRLLGDCGLCLLANPDEVGDRYSAPPYARTVHMQLKNRSLALPRCHFID